MLFLTFYIFVFCCRGAVREVIISLVEDFMSLLFKLVAIQDILFYKNKNHVPWCFIESWFFFPKHKIKMHYWKKPRASSLWFRTTLPHSRPPFICMSNLSSREVKKNDDSNVDTFYRWLNCSSVHNLANTNWWLMLYLWVQCLANNNTSKTEKCLSEWGIWNQSFRIATIHKCVFNTAVNCLSQIRMYSIDSFRVIIAVG